MNERWLTISGAEAAVRGHISGSIGRSQAILKDATASGQVRTQEPLVLNDDGVVGMRDRVIGERLINEDDLLDWLRRRHGASRAGAKAKGGRPPKFDRAAVGAEVIRLMDHHGEFSADDPEWNAQARLTEAIMAKFGEAAESTVDEYIKAPLAAWRERHPKT